jgi:hypothetical protein
MGLITTFNYSMLKTACRATPPPFPADFSGCSYYFDDACDTALSESYNMARGVRFRRIDQRVHKLVGFPKGDRAMPRTSNSAREGLTGWCVPCALGVVLVGPAGCLEGAGKGKKG